MKERGTAVLLHSEYRRTWHEFTVAVDSLQSALLEVSQGDADVAEARKRVDEAAAKYRDARNDLALSLLEHDAETNASEDVEALASALARSQAA